MAETKDKLATLSQVKRLVDSQSGGGGSKQVSVMVSGLSGVTIRYQSDGKSVETTTQNSSNIELSADVNSIMTFECPTRANMDVDQKFNYHGISLSDGQMLCHGVIPVSDGCTVSFYNAMP